VRTRPARKPRRTLWCAASAAILCAPAAHAAQPAAADPGVAAAAAARSIATVRLPVATLDGDIAASARRAWSWGSPGGATRLHLVGDVRLQLADYAFRAERASLWLVAAPDDPAATQVFAQLFDVGAPEADAAVSVRAERLPVHGVIRDADGPALAAPLINAGPPAGRDAELDLREAERSLARLLDSATPKPTDAISPPAPGPGPPQTPAAGDAPAPIFETGGRVYVSPGDRVTARSGADANTVTLTGGVVIQYAGPTRSLELTARRAVLFLRPGPLRDTFTQLDEADLLGVYLEGGVVATDGNTTLRGPRVYYDLREDRAVVLDAVFRTYDARVEAPLYLRAAAIRQEAANRFTADRATLANSAFATPHLALGVTTVTLERNPGPDGVARNVVDARGVTPELNGVPFLYVPRFRGDPERFPLRNVGFRDSNREGALYRTEWDPFVLLGIERPEALDSTLLVDYYEERGFALGTRTDWRTDRQHGDLLAYLVFDDNGTDLLGSGAEIDRDGDTRGIFLARHQARLTDLWTVTLEGSHLSDETVLPAFERNLARNTREITNRVHLRRVADNRTFSAEVKAATNDFAPVEHELQSPGYRVDKLPELKLAGYAEDLLDDTSPGLVSYTWETGFASLRQRFTEVTGEDLGVDSDRAFGIAPDRPVADAFRAQGLDESIVNRFDTRHEIALDLAAGPVDITPFMVGRVTAYDSDFQDFSPDEDDNARVFGAAGVRLGTTFHRVNDAVESRTFDLHRMRHIIEPSVTLWHGESTVATNDLPVYDDEVEPLAEGSVVRFGLDQTWQTKRGGPGRWRDVDVFELDFGWTFAGDGVDREGPVPRWYDPRPELSSTQRAVDVQGVWQVSEIVAIAGDWVYDVEDSGADRASIGATVEHGRGVRVTGEVRTLREQGDTYGNVVTSYPFGDKYDVRATMSYNFERNDFAGYSITTLRRFPNGQLGVTVNFDNIVDETSVGFVFRPTGFGVGTPDGGLGDGR